MRSALITCIALLVAACETAVPQFQGQRPAADTQAAPFAGVKFKFAGVTEENASNLIANHCARRGYTVLQRTNRQVLCGKLLKPEESVIAALYADDKLSDPPEYRANFTLTAIGLDTAVAAEHWFETKTVWGSRRKVGNPDQDPRTNLNVFLGEIGATPSG